MAKLYAFISLHNSIKEKSKLSKHPITSFSTNYILNHHINIKIITNKKSLAIANKTILLSKKADSENKKQRTIILYSSILFTSSSKLSFCFAFAFSLERYV